MRPSRHGFTLMEMLVATVAASVLLVAVYGVFSHGHRLRERAEARTRDARLQARALDLMRRDVLHAFVLAGPLAHTLQGDIQGLDGGYPGYLRLTTTTGRTRDRDIGSDVQEVEYYVQAADEWGIEGDTDDAGGVLVRTVQRILLTDAPDPPLVQPLLSRVEALTVTFFDGDQWLDQWDSTLTTNQLPAAVRVRVDRARSDDAESSVPPLEILVPWTTTPVANSVGPAEAGS